MASNTDYGIKVSQGGFDALTCPDYKLIFNSSWPLLNIVTQFSANVTALAAATLYTHNLGFIPMFLVWELDGSGGYMLANNDTYGIRATTTAITTLGGSTTNTLKIMIFNLSLTTTYTAPTIYTTTDSSTAVRNADYGMKVSKDGYDVSSTDFRDFIVHTGCRSPMVHTVSAQPDQTGLRTYTITHNMGSAPMAFAYLRTTAAPTLARLCDIGPESGSGVVLNSSATTVTAQITLSGQLTIVVLKDPIFIE